MEQDVIIIGAGLAGLAAADRLCQARRSVLLLEARDRIGGRVWTHHAPGIAAPIELGAEWFDTTGELRKLLRREGHAMRKAGGTFLQRVDGDLKAIDQEDRTGELLDRLRGLEGPDRPLAEALRSVRRPGDDPAHERTLLAYVQGFHTADPERLSTQWLIEVEESQSADASQVRSIDGADATTAVLKRHWGDHVRLQLGSVVQAVDWTPGAVRVHVREANGPTTYTAPQVLITLPLPVLQAGEASVRFDPPLTAKQEALGQLAMGHAVKVVLVFREAFWEQERTLRKALFIQDPRQPLPTWWTTRPLEAPVLNGWAGGPMAGRLLGLGPSELREAAIASLTGAMGVPRSTVEQQLLHWHTHDWAHDPFARGAYSYVLAGGLHAHAAIAAPLDRTLYFAGEATCGGGYNATMEGAVRSGQRAAQEILDESGVRPPGSTGP